MMHKASLLVPFVLGTLAVALPGPAEPAPADYKPAPPADYKPPTDYKPPPEDDCPVLCIDGINECGEGWGGCYPTCEPDKKPTPKPCTPTVTAKPYEPPAYSSSSKKEDDCSTRTVCADYVNSCGMMYGGCFPDCKPWPTFTPPPCPKETPKYPPPKETPKYPPPKDTPPPPKDTPKYPPPKETPPPKDTPKYPPPKETPPPKDTPKYPPPKDTPKYPPPKESPPPKDTPKYPPPKETPPPKDTPKYPPPKETPKYTPANPCDKGPVTKCVDKVNECGMKYGGCYDTCKTATPSFSTPSCPEKTYAPYPPPTKPTYKPKPKDY